MAVIFSPIIFVVGNKDFEEDSIPFRILPKLKKRFPDIRFVCLDPNEEFEVPEHLYIIDIVENIKKVSIFHDPAVFEKSPRITVHDFDLVTNLLLLKKLGKLPALIIIGIPPHLKEKDALKQTEVMIRSNVLSENERHNSCRGHKHE